jgi:hypothetical protein
VGWKETRLGKGDEKLAKRRSAGVYCFDQRVTVDRILPDRYSIVAVKSDSGCMGTTRSSIE